MRDIELDGNRTGNTLGLCLAVYGQEPYILNVSVKNAPEYGIRMEWGDGADPYGMEGYMSNLKIDTCGKHGFWYKGPHDSTIIGLIVIDAGQSANNNYDGILIENPGNGRFIGCHVWNRNSSLRHRYALNDSGEGNEFVGCHFEGAYTANVYANGTKTTFSACRFYAAWNGLNILVKKPSISIVGCYLSDPGEGRPACKGIVLGNTVADWISDCLIDIHAIGQQAGIIDFTNSDGSNVVKVCGYNASGVGYIGYPKPSDYVELLISGINVKLIQH